MDSDKDSNWISGGTLLMFMHIGYKNKDVIYASFPHIEGIRVDYLWMFL